MVGEGAIGTLGLVKDDVWERRAVARGRSSGRTRAKGTKEDEEDTVLPVVVTGRLVVVVVVVVVAVDAVGWTGAAKVLGVGAEPLTAWLPFGSTSRLFFFFLFVSCK